MPYSSPDVSNMWNSFLGFEMSQGETCPLSHDAVRVFQESDEIVDDVVAGIAGATEGDCCHGTDVGVWVLEQSDESIHHRRILELSCVFVCE